MTPSKRALRFCKSLPLNIIAQNSGKLTAAHHVHRPCDSSHDQGRCRTSSIYSNVFQAIFSVTVVLTVAITVTEATTEHSIVPHNLEIPFPYDPVKGDLEDTEFRIAIEPSRNECFHQDVKAAHNFEVRFRVVEQTSRLSLVPTTDEDLTIGFRVIAPSGEILTNMSAQREGDHAHLSKAGGVYQICLDNSQSSFSTKVVSIEIYVYSDSGEDRWAGAEFTMPPELQFMDLTETIKSSLDRVRDNLIRVSHAQESRRSIETRDRNTAESNFTSVNRFSILIIFVVISVGLLQIFFIRSLFEEKSLLKKVLK